MGLDKKYLSAHVQVQEGFPDIYDRTDRFHHLLIDQIYGGMACPAADRSAYCTG